MLVSLIALTLFVSAFLLFWCQPMVAKMVLPFLGGSASVWTACVLFFQTMLLAGYVYAHLLNRRVRLRGQFFVHATLLLAGLIFLPIRFAATTAGRSASDAPVLWLLQHLIVAAGIPFLLVSTTAPLLQSWLAATRTKSGRDPYFLYAASNAGSLLSLVLYPLLIEPQFGASGQSRLWMAGYGMLILLVIGVAAMSWKNGRPPAEHSHPDLPLAPPTLKSRLYWLMAACVPSALMLAVTTHISTDLASVPFLWIIPLAIYLLTFILAFSTRIRLSPAQLSWAAPIFLLFLLPIVPDVAPPVPLYNWTLMAGHLTILFFGAYLCHTALAARRPDSRQLTEFYFWIALGGALGGIFSAVVAPAVFSTVMEYPLLVAALPFFRELRRGEEPFKRKDLLYPGILGAVFFVIWYVERRARIDASNNWAAIVPDVIFFVAVFLFRDRRIRFAAGFAVLLFGYVWTMPELVEHGERMYVARNFFGVKKVLFDRNRNVRRLLHGDTLHGEESMDPVKSGQPMTYYHQTGPAGDVMNLISSRPDQRVGVVGLGSGTMATYAGPDRHMIFFDIDPQVEDIAHYSFTFMRRCAANCDVVIADGRLALAQLHDGQLDVLMLDAFSSDSIPAHLVSREALKMYETKLKPNGLMLFHVSNRYLNVGKLVAAALTDAGLTGLYRSDRDSVLPDKSGSDYVVAARHIQDLAGLVATYRWIALAPETSIRPWTDDYSDMLPLLKWR